MRTILEGNHALQTKKTQEVARPRSLVKVRWTPLLRRVNDKYPSALRSKKWPEIARLANGGFIDAAMDLAKETETSGEIIFKNTLTRRLRIERATWFARMNRGEKELRQIFGTIGSRLAAYVEKHGTKTGNINRLNERIREEMVELRRSIRTWLSGLVRDTTKIALRNAGDALRPIFKDSQEAYEETIDDDLIFDILEAKRSISVSKKIASKDPGVKFASAKWRKVQKKIIKKVMKKNVVGIITTDKIWELTTRADATLRRVVAAEVARGTPAHNIARKVQKFVSPAKIDEAQELGLRGVYASPYKNAIRLARTETNRAYAGASAEYGRNKVWNKGYRFNLSPIHNVSDICDQWANVVVDQEEYDAMLNTGQFPFHPHCRCFVTYEIDDKFLDKEAA